MTLAAAAVIELLTFHMVDGRVVQINPQQITQLIHSHVEGGNNVLVETVECVIRLTDGSFVSVAETCEEVQQAIEERK